MLGSIFSHGQNHYGQVILTPETLAAVATAPETFEEMLSFHHLLASDEYVQYVDAYYREGLRRFGRHWRYMDISSVLYSTAKLLQPKTYLEIGVRRGRSACMVVRGCPTVNVTAFDMWIQNYAGIENPGADFVQQELVKHGHTGAVSFVNGDSHQTVPAFFKQNPQLFFDMITVDGDHSETGALDDLCTVIPRLSKGGIIVFDDIAHPSHPHLMHSWRRAISAFPSLSGYEFTEAGFGVAFAIRRSE